MMNFESELVSIVTPAYKAARFVGATIESVIAQDYLQWEMLVVDDRSPDDTAEIVARYAAADPRVKLIRQAENGGAAAARNAALEAARGRYVAFLDSDDVWMPGKLSLQLSFMREVGAGLSFTSFRRITQDGRRTGRLVSVPSSLDYASLLKNTAIVTSTVVIDRSAAGNIRMTKTYYDDFVLWLGLLKRGVIARGLRLDLLRYRVVEQSISRNKVNSARQVWRTYRDIEGLGVLPAGWCFANYAGRAWLKYRRF
ncbi:MAG TPA: glycosyltransferase family 2 protein [Steroidobacteraceae bacterium]|jgi:teichuronic acid biosynthesis glycosyltransferase TuaG|nr:glycosyltransferase family 2 protein [Steroidobacteraceae bacterium]